MKRRSPSLYLFALAALAVGCAGGGGVSQPNPPLQINAPVQLATVTFTVTLGSASAPAARMRHPNYLSPGTQSMTIVPVVPGFPNQAITTIDLSSGANGCTGSGATLACTTSLKAPVGQTTFSVTTYSSSNAAGNVLSVGTFVVNVLPTSSTATIDNATSLTIDGVPASFSLSVSPTTITIGSPETLVATVTTRDAANAIIVGPGTYASGIALEQIVPLVSANAVSILALTSPTLVAPVTACTYAVSSSTSCLYLETIDAPVAVPLQYGGQFVPGTSFQVVAEAPGLASSAVTVQFATTAPGGSPPPATCSGSPIVACPGAIVFPNAASPAVTLTLSEPGVGAFSLQINDCKGLIYINGGISGSGTSFAISPTGGSTVGSCSLGATDQNGNTTTIPVTVIAPGPSPTPSSSPTPVVTATPVPLGNITILPANSLEFPSSTAPPQTFTASEAGYGSFSIDQSLCAGIVTVSPTTGTAFTVTPNAALGQGGKCTVNVLDGSQRQPTAVGIYVDGVSFHVDKR